MIEIEILDAPDVNAICAYKFMQNELNIGKEQGELQIQDPDLCRLHCMLEVIDTELIFHPQKGVEFYLIDGKRSSSVRKLKIGQKITIGKTIFKVNQFATTVHKTKKQILDAKLSALMEIDSPMLAVIELLANKTK